MVAYNCLFMFLSGLTIHNFTLKSINGKKKDSRKLSVIIMFMFITAIFIISIKTVKT